jgi:hypothetical protein
MMERLVALPQDLCFMGDIRERLRDSLLLRPGLYLSHNATGPDYSEKSGAKSRCEITISLKHAPARLLLC